MTKFCVDYKVGRVLENTCFLSVAVPKAVRFDVTPTAPPAYTDVRCCVVAFRGTLPIPLLLDKTLFPAPDRASTDSNITAPLVNSSDDVLATSGEAAATTALDDAGTDSGGVLCVAGGSGGVP